MQPMAMSDAKAVRPSAMMLAGTHTSCQSGLIDNVKSRMVLYLRDSRDLREKRNRCDGQWFEVQSSRFSELRTRNFELYIPYGLLVSRTIHGG
jgi:hypothetical protein